MTFFGLAFSITLMLTACSESEPVDPPAKIFSVTVEEDTAEPALRPTSINQAATLTLRLSNDDQSSVVVMLGCGVVRAVVERQEGDMWREVGETGCDDPGEQTIAPSDTVTAATWFSVGMLDVEALAGTYRLRVLAAENDNALPADLVTSDAFEMIDTPLYLSPESFAPGVISTDDEEWRVIFTPDGSRAYFARSDQFFPFSRQATIYESNLTDGVWSAPTVASFSGTYPDIDPFITPDGARLYFSSIRPVDGEDRTDLDLWFVEWTGSGWGSPIHTGAVNSPADELYASIDEDGVLYVASDRTGGVGGFDIYRADPLGDGRYSEAENVGAPVNTTRWEFNPAISRDGETLAFTGLNYPGGAGFGDIYVTEREGTVWATPSGLGGLVNTSADEYHPSFSPDERLLFFIRYGADGDFNVVSWPLP